MTSSLLSDGIGLVIQDMGGGRGAVQVEIARKDEGVGLECGAMGIETG